MGCLATLSAEDVCRTDNFLDRLDNFPFSSYLYSWIFLALLLHIILLFFGLLRLVIPVRSGTGSRGIWAGTGPGPVPVDLAGTRPVPQFFFMFYYRFYDELPASRAVPGLYHVLPSSSQTASRALLQFLCCIMCSPPVPRLYQLSCGTLEFTKCMMPPPPPLATLGEENYLYFHRLLLLLISH